MEKKARAAVSCWNRMRKPGPCKRPLKSGVPVSVCVVIRGGRSNYFDGLGSIDYFYESNRYFLPVTLDPITCQFHCDIRVWAEGLQVQVYSDMNPRMVRTTSAADCCMCVHRI